jgi:hypothetical protein
LKIEEDGSDATAYVMAYYQVFNKTGGKLEEGVGTVTSFAIALRKDGAGKYQTVEFWKPEDGNRYTPSLQKKFPKELWDKVDTQFYVKALSADISRQAANIKL